MRNIRPPDARRGYLRLPKFPNFSKGESFPPLTPAITAQTSVFLWWGIRARQLVILFTIEKDSPYSSDSDAFLFMLKVSRTRASVSNIYIFTQTGAHPMPSSWRHLPKTIPKTRKRHCGEKLNLAIFLHFLTRNPIFVLTKCVRVSKHFKITIKLFAFSNNKKKFLTYFLFVSLRVF